MRIKFLIPTIFVFLSSVSYCMTVRTLYGVFKVSNPIIADLITSRAVTRLKRIHQYGVGHYIHPTKVEYNRYDHSVGVFVLLKKFGAPLQEQVAGLLHDVSHTVFSHVGDHVCAKMDNKILNQNDEAYQDSMHEWYVAQTDIPDILKRYEYTIQDINPKQDIFGMLERPLPDLCADRLEYQLKGAFIEGWIDQQEIDDMLNALSYEDRWIFTDHVQARKLAELSIRLCMQIFGASWNACAYENAADALLRAVHMGAISMDDIHFGHDDTIWKLLCYIQDEHIQQAICNVKNAKHVCEPATQNEYDLSCKIKFRGIDPWVQTDDGCKRLTQIDSSFAHVYTEAKKQLSGMHYYKYKHK